MTAPRPRVNERHVAIACWIVVALPALYQLWLLATAIGGRVAYPYDLEWMEGGMLHHAARIADGRGIYVPPSVDFIPYLYTPLYPAWLAMLGRVFGLSYALGRAISVLSLVGIAGVAAASIAWPVRHERTRVAAVVGVVSALALFAATYPFVEGWFDLVRADTLFLFMVTATITALPWWAREGTGLRGHARVAAGAALLALAFFCKQTGIFYVALGGAIVVVVNWRRAATFAAVAGAIGLGGVALLDDVTAGWFWTYASKIHRAHDFLMKRFWDSFGNILWHFPVLTIVVAIGLVVVALTAWQRRALPREAKTFLLWTAAFAVSTVVGALGWGTEFAHFNAYMPAFLHGGLAAGAAIPAIAACVRRDPDFDVAFGGWLAAFALAITLAGATWQPSRFVPTAADRAAGDKLIARIRALPGDVWMPSHPWYLALAGKTPHVHRMGVKDVTAREPRPIAGLDDAIAHHRFGALVLDNHDLQTEYQVELQGLRLSIRDHYRQLLALPADERPRVFTGAQVVPDSIWVPAVVTPPPPGAHVVFDFEAVTWDGWTRSGPAWGDGPAAEPLPGQDAVIGASGRRFATSMHGGDAATGRVTSPLFLIDGARMTMKLGGGTDATKLRVELWVDGAIVHTASAPAPGGDTLQSAGWDVAALRGKQGQLVLVDDGTRPGDHLDVDDVWMWANP